MHIKEIGFEGGSCFRMAAFCISGVEPSRPITRS